MSAADATAALTAKAVANSQDLIPVKSALISVFDKAGIDDLGAALKELGISVISTGGTAKKLRDGGLDVKDVADVTKWPEMLGGRVKTLHPAVHGGILANRGDAEHIKCLDDLGVAPIDMVVCNLYQFEKAVASGKSFEECIEMIDIGGPTMIRASAKNCDSVACITSPDQYAAVIAELKANNGALTKKTRRALSLAAFTMTARYDAAVSAYMAQQTEAAALHTRHYVEEFPLKYGVNPHQAPAALSSVAGYGMPFTIINGKPGYTNLMDALNSWQLCSELEVATGLPAAASFKHVSPAGAAVGVPLTDVEREIYGVASDTELSMQAVAYIRARNADPMSSFGDFIAVSGIVDVCTAETIKREVSDGIIAAGFEPAALEILKAKKKGGYLILQGNKDFVPPVDEFKECYGVALSQKRNDAVITKDIMSTSVTETPLTDAAIRDMVVATIAVKYTQSNSVCYAVGGQVIGVGAGQQSRVDCVKLAGRKVCTWHMRSHPKVRGLKFKEGTKRVDKTNARVAYISDEMTAPEQAIWAKLFDEPPVMLTSEEKVAWMTELKDVAISSDAFFPFRDNIDQATKFGVKYIVQPGGSAQDQTVINACNDYGIAMAFSKVRLFHH
jgi:phosphoribosylaminoimidazolecarboxamide formyltransferase/IMP cyclohydrolase